MESNDSTRSSETPVLTGLHGAIKEFRDRVTRAAALISDLRRRKDDLENSITTMEASMQNMETTMRSLHSDLAQKQAYIEQLESQLSTRGEFPSSGLGVEVSEKLLYLTPDEREALERQIGDLLSRIDAHLG